MLLLKAVERNWVLMGPGSWEKRSWKIHRDGTYQMKTTYRPMESDDPIPDQTEEGALSDEQMEKLQECIDAYWSDAATDACDGSAWEFKLYQDDTVIRHRETGHIYGIEPFESIAALLSAE